MTPATSLDSTGTGADVAQIVMGRIAEQVLAMGQQAFEHAMSRPDEDVAPHDDVEDDEGDDQ